MFFWNVDPAPVSAPLPHGMLPACTPVLPLLPELSSVPHAVRPSRPPPRTRMAAGVPQKRFLDTRCPFGGPARRAGDFSFSRIDQDGVADSGSEARDDPHPAPARQVNAG